MKISDFDAVINSWPSPSKSMIKGFLVTGEREIPVSVSLYEIEGGETVPDQPFVRIQADQDLALGWNDSFEVLDRKNGAILFKGRVLLPFHEEVRPKGIKKRLEMLRGLSGHEKEMLLTYTKAHGVKGLTENELIEFSSLTRDIILDLSKHLEGEGKIRILSFSPLFLLSQDRFEFLCKRVLAYVSDYHEKHPEDFGVSLKKIRQRFGLPQKVLALALKQLDRTGQIIESEKGVALRDFYPHPSPEEERLLKDIEAMYLEGEHRSVSLGEMQKRFCLSKKKLDRMLTFLVERRKIVLGKDGFLLHARWLDNVIQEVCGSEKKELSVSDFKKMTGLSRKYAIPLLELLDQMGVTRRKGPTREIIRDMGKKSGS